MFPSTVPSFKPMIEPIMADQQEQMFLEPIQGRPTLVKKIDALDFAMQKMKMCLPVEREGKGWTPEHANETEGFYKMFLKLNLLYPEKKIVPSHAIDEFWHSHILDTRKYHRDCQEVFGRLLHHFPYFGLRSEDDARDLENSWHETCRLFKEHFGINPAKMAHSWNDCSNCGSTG